MYAAHAAAAGATAAGPPAASTADVPPAATAGAPVTAAAPPPPPPDPVAPATTAGHGRTAAAPSVGAAPSAVSAAPQPPAYASYVAGGGAPVGVPPGGPPVVGPYGVTLPHGAYYPPAAHPPGAHYGAPPPAVSYATAPQAPAGSYATAAAPSIATADPRPPAPHVYGHYGPASAPVAAVPAYRDPYSAGTQASVDSYRRQSTPHMVGASPWHPPAAPAPVAGDPRVGGVHHDPYAAAAAAHAASAGRGPPPAASSFAAPAGSHHPASAPRRAPGESRDPHRSEPERRGSVYDRLSDPSSFTGVYRRAYESDGRINAHSNDGVHDISETLRPSHRRGSVRNRPSFR